MRTTPLEEHTSTGTISRRSVLRGLGAIATMLAGGCTPTRVILRAYPAQFRNGSETSDRVLRAFAVTVVPSASEDHPNLIRALGDPQFPLAPHRGFLASDLDQRAMERHSTPFDQLPPATRAAVIADGLAADRITRKLYTGAILLTQIAFYAGIYDDGAGCPLIGFEGRYQFRGLANITYPDAAAFLAASATSDGNPA